MHLCYGYCITATVVTVCYMTLMITRPGPYAAQRWRAHDIEPTCVFAQQVQDRGNFKIMPSPPLVADLGHTL